MFGGFFFIRMKLHIHILSMYVSVRIIMEPKIIILREQSCIISHNFSCRRPQCSAVSWDLLWLKPRINHDEKVKVAAQQRSAARQRSRVCCAARTRGHVARPAASRRGGRLRKRGPESGVGLAMARPGAVIDCGYGEGELRPQRTSCKIRAARSWARTSRHCPPQTERNDG